MKKIFCFLLLLISCTFLFSQKRTTITDKQIVKDTLILRGNAVSAISKDATMSGASDLNLPTQKAVKDYISSVVASGKITLRAGKPSPLTTFITDAVVDTVGVDSLWIWNASIYRLLQTGGGSGTTNLSYVTDASTGTISNSNGTGAILPEATDLIAGLLSATKKLQYDAKNSGIQFKDEGTNLGAQGTVNALDFTGIGVSATRSGNTLTVNVTGGGGGGISTQTLADTAKNVRNMVRDYVTGSNKLNGVINLDMSDYNQEYDFIPNSFAVESTPSLNYIRPEFNYGNAISTLGGAVITYNTVQNEFSQKLAERITASAGTDGKVFWQVSSSIYPALLTGSYTLTWRMRTETGTYNIKHGTLNSETITSLSTTWTTFSFNFTYTGANQYVVLCMETGGNAVDVRMGDVFLLRQSPIYPPVARKSDSHAYTWNPSDFLYNAKLGNIFGATVTPADSILFDTICIAAVVRPTYSAGVPAYGSVFSDRLDFGSFWFGTQSDSILQFIMTGSVGANSPVVLNSLNNYLGKIGHT